MTNIVSGELARMMEEAAQSIVPAGLRAAGWRYVDLPGKLSDDMWNLFIGLLGEAGTDYQIIVISAGPGWKRGQFLMSPQALQNLANYKGE